MTWGFWLALGLLVVPLAAEFYVLRIHLRTCSQPGCTLPRTHTAPHYPRGRLAPDWKEAA